MDANERWVYLFYALAAVLLAVVLARILGVTVGAVGIHDPEVLGEQLQASGLVAMAVVAVAGLLVLRHQGLKTKSLAVVAELRKVSWPSREDTKTATMVVVVTSFMFGIYLGVLDLFWGWMSGLVY